MTTDEKIQAVEEFLDWRENTDPTAPPARLVEKWRSALEGADDAATLAEIRREAEFVKDAGEAFLLVERIRNGR